MVANSLLENASLSSGLTIGKSGSGSGFGAFSNDDDFSMDSLLGGEFSELCASLNENDKGITTLTIGDPSHNERRITKLAKSLHDNNVVTKVVFDFRYMNPQFENNDLLDFIQLSSSLSSIDIQNINLSNSSACSILVVLLKTISQNENILDITFDSREVVYLDNLTSFFHSAASIADKFLHGEKVDTIALQGMIASCFRELRYLESLWLEHLDEVIFLQILAELRGSSALHVLAVVPKYATSCESSFIAIGALLTYSQSIRQLELHECILSDRVFAPIARSIRHNSSLIELSFHDTYFDGRATNTLRELYCLGGQKHSVCALTIGQNVIVHDQSIAVFLSDLVKNPRTSMRALDVRFSDLSTKQRNGKSGLHMLLHALKGTGKVDSHWAFEKGAQVVSTFLPSYLMNRITEEGEEASTIRSESDHDNSEPGRDLANLTMEKLDLGEIQTDEELEALKDTILKLLNLRDISFRLGNDTLHAREELLSVCRASKSVTRCTINDEKIKTTEQGDALRRQRSSRSLGTKSKSVRSLLRRNNSEKFGNEGLKPRSHLQLGGKTSSSRALKGKRHGSESSVGTRGTSTGSGHGTSRLSERHKTSDHSKPEAQDRRKDQMKRKSSRRKGMNSRSSSNKSLDIAKSHRKKEVDADDDSLHDGIGISAEQVKQLDLFCGDNLNNSTASTNSIDVGPPSEVRCYETKGTSSMCDEATKVVRHPSTVSYEDLDESRKRIRDAEEILREIAKDASQEEKAKQAEETLLQLVDKSNKENEGSDSNDSFATYDAGSISMEQGVFCKLNDSKVELMGTSVTIPVTPPDRDL